VSVARLRVTFPHAGPGDRREPRLNSDRSSSVICTRDETHRRNGGDRSVVSSARGGLLAVRASEDR
jgi:hypothetical protein